MAAINVGKDGVKTIVSLTGELDIANVEEFNQIFNQILDSAPKKLEVDLKDLEFIDSTGVRSLMTLIKGANQKNIDVVITRINEMVYEVLETTGMIQLFGKEIFLTA